VARSSAISKLLAGLQRAPHDYAAPTSIFPSLSIDRLAADLKLSEKGAERGKENEPPSGSAGFDDVENLIVDRIEYEKRTVSDLYNDQIQTYRARLDNLDFAGRFAEIRQLAPQAVADFKVDANQGRDELYVLRRRIVATEKDRETFRTKHKIDRSARISSTGAKTLKVGLLLLLIVVEIGVNAIFLSKGNEQGVLGGAVQAFSFALLNVLVSFLIGLFLISLLNHRGVLLKLIGLVSLGAYLLFAVAVNLALAHIREVSSLLTPETGAEVMRRLHSAPLQIDDITSWVFFAVGLTFSILAMLDGLFFRDPYPGYAAIESSWLAAQDRYVIRKAELIEELREIRDEVSDGMQEIARDLSLKQSEFSAIVQSRARLNTAFVDVQSQLERAAMSLLSIYREANRRARSDAQPERFGSAFTLDRIAIVSEIESEGAQNELKSSIKSSQEMLVSQAETVNTEFEAAVARYHQIDDLIPEAADGSSTQK
jgi:hypothetical protein